MKWYKYNINDMTEAEYQKFLGLASDKKKEKIAKLKRVNDRKRSICGEMLVKCAVAEKTGTPVDLLVFETEESGKPYCRGVNLEFSISHSGDYAVCAVNDKPIGIDIQKVESYSEKVAKKVCSEAELAEIEKADNKAREFIKIWTKKEAVLKRDGKSIFSADLKNCLVGESVETFDFSDYFISIAY